MKFKVFDKEKKEFVEEVHFVLTHGGILRSVASNIIHVCALSFIPVFSTGQKDIDGNEIHEGDIVKGEEGSIKEVYYADGCFWAGNSFNFIDSEDLEIIGSIYTNPELLEE